MLLGKIALPFLLSHTLITALVLNSNSLSGGFSALHGATSNLITVFGAQESIEYTSYTSEWAGSTDSLFRLYFLVLPFSALGATLLSMAVLQPLLRYSRDRLMSEFSVAKQWRDLL